MNRGDKYRPIVTIVKVKRDVPTVIKVSGHEYVLRPEGQFNQRKKTKEAERIVSEQQTKRTDR